MKQEYIFNIGIVSTDKTIKEEYFFNFVLNTKCIFDNNTQQNGKSYEENKTELYELVNEVVTRYAAKKDKDKDILKKYTSYSNFNKAPNNSFGNKITNKEVNESTKYKLGIICNGYFNNQLLEINKKNDTTIINKNDTTILELFTRISQQLCLLGYHVECVPYKDNQLYNNGAPIITYHKLLGPTINTNFNFDFTKDKVNQYKSIAQAKYYYYKINIENYKNYEQYKNNGISNDLENIYNSLTPNLYFVDFKKYPNIIFILSLHDLIKGKYANDVNEYIKDVLLLYFKKLNYFI